MATKPLTIRLENDLLAKLAKVAKKHHSSLNAAALFAIESYFEWRELQDQFEAANKDQSLRGVEVVMGHVDEVVDLDKQRASHSEKQRKLGQK